MARLLFELSGVRRRNGQLAAGVAYVVSSDEAGTALADISATSGATATSTATVVADTSTVTTADIAGLGPASLRFYGPDDVDTLYLGSSDASLGVQKIGAATDPRLDALEAGGGGSHPNLAVHDALGLATDAELSAHAVDTTAVHGITDTTVLATTSGVASSIITHAAAVDPHADRAYARAYADSVAQGLDVKLSVRVATTANLTLSGEQTIDGVLTSADRVLVKNQTAGAANGIYVSAAGAWSRAVDADISAEVSPGSFTFVEEGTVNGGTGWVQATPDPVVLDTSALVFTQFSGGGTILGGAGLLKTGNTLDVGAGTGISVAADTVGIASGGVTNTQVNAAAGIAESKLALNFPTHAESHASRHAAAGADPLVGYVLTGDHTAAAHDALGLATDAELTTHGADTTAVHGITDTTQLALKNASNVFTANQRINGHIGINNTPVGPIDARAGGSCFGAFAGTGRTERGLEVFHGYAPQDSNLEDIHGLMILGIMAGPRQSGASPGHVYGAEIQAESLAVTGADPLLMCGVNGLVNYRSNQTVPNAFAISGQVQLDDNGGTQAGLITNAYALFAQNSFRIGTLGNITNAVGVYAQEQTLGTNKWSIYSESHVGINGNGRLGIGFDVADGVPTHPLQVRSRVDGATSILSAGAIIANFQQKGTTTPSVVGYIAWTDSSGFLVGGVGVENIGHGAGTGDWVIVTRGAGFTTPAIKIPNAGGLVVGTAGALATTAVDGFLYLPSCAGTPTGSPTAQTGTVPVLIDTTASKLWARIGGTWKSVTLA